MSRMGLHDSFGHLKHKLWPKERLGVKLPIWPLTTKSQESPQFFPCRWRATYCWKDLDKGYNFAWIVIAIEGMHTKLWSPKVVRVSTLRISGLPFGRLERKCHLDVGLVDRHKIYYKGEGDGFSQVWPWWVLWVHVCSWFVPTPKVLKLCNNQFVVCFVQIHVND
jgi:hypothetical protein